MVRLDCRARVVIHYVYATCSAVGFVILFSFFLSLKFLGDWYLSVVDNPEQFSRDLLSGGLLTPLAVCFIFFIPYFYVLLFAKRVDADFEKELVYINGTEYPFYAIQLSRIWVYFGLNFCIVSVRQSEEKKSFVFIAASGQNILPFGYAKYSGGLEFFKN